MHPAPTLPTATHSPATSWPHTALLRLWVVWYRTDASGHHVKKTFHSYDSSGRYEVADPAAYGKRGLRKRVLDGAHGAGIKEAILYDNQTGQQLEVWVKNGIRQ